MAVFIRKVFVDDGEYKGEQRAFLVVGVVFFVEFLFL